MAVPKEERYTADEFLALTPVSNELTELFDGYVYAQAAPSEQHHDLTTELFSALRSFIKSKGGSCKPFHSPFDVRIDKWNVVQPDVFVVCDPAKRDGKRINGAPDFVIEVVSSDRENDFYKKLLLYKESGVREYWIVDPENRKSLVYCFEAGDFPAIYTFEEPIPVGIWGGELSIAVAELL